jgi:DNA-binding GntR family transcriptional regulator
MSTRTLESIPSVPRHSTQAPKAAAGSVAYGLLRDAIVRTILKPGAALSEAEVALKMGVSRTPVREAFRKLAAEHLLVVSPQVGTIVARLSSKAIGNALFVRDALECAAVRLAVTAPLAERLRLGEIVRLQQAAIAAGDVEMNLAHDEAFHRAIMELAGHTEAWPLVAQARDHLERLRRIAIPELRGNEDAARQHAGIAAAIAAGDAVLAERRLSKHVYLATSFVDGIRAAHPEYFDNE